jgi:YidC/Oxa1 family membrane protein insertase
MSFRSRREDSRASKSGAKEIARLPLAERRVVFYAESAADWAFLGPVFRSFAESVSSVIRVTSDPNDPVLTEPKSYYIGSGLQRTVYFKTAEADLFVMTLTDLDTMQLKRSVHNVHYAYIFHSIASCHRIYRDRAFDAYDTLLCAGPHQVRELRRLEEVHNLKPRALLEYGYARLDTLLDAASEPGDPSKLGPEPGDGGGRVLVAPSWGPTSLVDHDFQGMIESLIDDRHAVTVRLHPMTRRHHAELESQLVERFDSSGRFQFDPNLSATASLLAADTMITEWSGSAYDYAFSRLRPVLFVDTPPKINNPKHPEVEYEPFEDWVRPRIGTVVGLDDMARVGAAVRKLVGQASDWAASIEEVRDESVFNVGRSSEVGAKHLLELYSGLRSTH